MASQDHSRQCVGFSSNAARLAIIPADLNSHKVQLAIAASLATILIAVLGAIAQYIANYYTTSVGQWVANELRLKTYHHLQQLSLSFYDSHQTGPILSTITADVQTIQNFASSSTLGSGCSQICSRSSRC
jgi:ABC-type multidrug transport system fused ATPase/permease subunit